MRELLANRVDPSHGRWRREPATRDDRDRRRPCDRPAAPGDFVSGRPRVGGDRRRSRRPDAGAGPRERRPRRFSDPLPRGAHRRHRRLELRRVGARRRSHRLHHADWRPSRHAAPAVGEPAALGGQLGDDAALRRRGALRPLSDDGGRGRLRGLHRRDRRTASRDRPRARPGATPEPGRAGAPAHRRLAPRTLRLPVARAGGHRGAGGRDHLRTSRPERRGELRPGAGRHGRASGDARAVRSDAGPDDRPGR